MPNNTMTFGVDLLPQTDGNYNLGTTNQTWKIYGSIQGGQNGQVLKSTGTNSVWQDEYKVEIVDLITSGGS